LHLAYYADEAQVLREFEADARHAGRGYDLLSARQILDRFPAVQANGLTAGLWSPMETCVDPREVVAKLPEWLQQVHGIDFAFNRGVLGYDRPIVRTTAGELQARQLVVCNGD